jgi:hypothetical protein
MDPEQIFKKSSFIPNSISTMSIEDATNLLHRKTSIDKMIQTHNDLLIKFFEILKQMEEENKKSKCCNIQ